MAGAGVIDDYLSTLAGRLRGRRRTKEDLLGELRDGLTDAFLVHREAGIPTADAERKAVSELGDVDRIRAEYQTELGVQTATHALRATALALLGTQILWYLAMASTADHLSPIINGAPHWYGILAAVYRVGHPALIGLGLVAVFSGRLVARIADSQWIIRSATWLIGILGGGSLLALLVWVGGTSSINIDWLFLPWPYVAVMALTLLVHVRIFTLIRDCRRSRPGTRMFSAVSAGH